MATATVADLGDLEYTVAGLRDLEYTGAGLRDLEYKVRRAMDFRGARYLHILVPCPLGRGSASCDTIRVARHRIDLDYCKGCGISVPECPCGSVVMEPEP